MSEVSWLTLVVLLEDIWLHIALGHSMGGTSWNAAACVSMSQKAEGPWAQGRAGQMWVAGLCSTRVALATVTAVSHCIQVILDHTSALNGSCLSMSNLLGGAQNALTGKCDQRNVYKMPFTSGCPVPLSNAQGWWPSQQLPVPRGTRLCPTTALHGLSWQLSVAWEQMMGRHLAPYFSCLFKHHTESPGSKDFI